MGPLPIAILSPHFDDAAFSCGLTMHALLRAAEAVTVINVFTRSEYAVDLRTVDASLPAVEGVSAARLREDEAFLEDVAASTGSPVMLRMRKLNWLDAPLRLAVRTEQVLESPLSDDEVAEQAKALAAELATVQSFDFVFAPLALGDHVDHRIAREAAKLWMPADRICWYEDQPYAARLRDSERNQLPRRLVASKADDDTAGKLQRYTTQVRGGTHLKERLAMHYPSQIAPEVAREMAADAARWGPEGGERWWAASGALRAILQGRLQGSDAAVIAETVIAEE